MKIQQKIIRVYEDPTDLRAAMQDGWTVKQMVAQHIATAHQHETVGAVFFLLEKEFKE
jgi:hypothetical protein